MTRPTMKVLEIGGIKKTFVDLELETGLSRKTLYGRWVVLGCPMKLDDKQEKRLLRKPSHVVISPTEITCTVMPGFRKMTITDILKMPWCKVSRSSVVVRIKRNNGVVWEHECKPIRKGDEHWGELSSTYLRKCDYLPHIKAGDLAHLSDSFPNTGSGRGEIPDEVWIQSYGKRKAVFIGKITV